MNRAGLRDFVHRFIGHYTDEEQTIELIQEAHRGETCESVYDTSRQDWGR